MGVQMNQQVEFLKETDLFRGLSEQVIEEELLPHGQTAEIGKEIYLLRPSDRLDYFGIVLEGMIYTMHIFGDGNHSIIDHIGPGEMFGSDLIYTRTRISPYHVVTASEVKMLRFPAVLLTEHNLLPERTRHQIKENLLKMISQDNMRREYRLAILSQKGLRERVMTYLSMQATKRHKNTFTVPFSRENLAAYLCVNRSALSHELSMMQKEGLISFHKNTFSINQERIQEDEIYTVQNMDS